MTDASHDTTTPDEPGRRRPDGWAAWSKKSGDPLQPAAEEATEAPETEAPVTDEAKHD